MFGTRHNRVVVHDRRMDRCSLFERWLPNTVEQTADNEAMDGPWHEMDGRESKPTSCLSQPKLQMFSFQSCRICKHAFRPGQGTWGPGHREKCLLMTHLNAFACESNTFKGERYIKNDLSDGDMVVLEAGWLAWSITIGSTKSCHESRFCFALQRVSPLFLFRAPSFVSG